MPTSANTRTHRSARSSPADLGAFHRVALISNGDMRYAVGVTCWPKQEETLKEVEKAFDMLGVETYRAHPYKPEEKCGFVKTQAEAAQVCAGLDPRAPVAMVLSSWTWAHHFAGPLCLHKGPILIIGNFDGTWPGLVAVLNHSASFERMHIPHSKIWSQRFSKDPAFMKNLKAWTETGTVQHNEDHVTPLKFLKVREAADRFGEALAADILKKKRILGQLDPGCMGMLNAVISPNLAAGIGMPVEYLNQSDLLAEMKLVSDDEAQKTLDWLIKKKTHFDWGDDFDKDLTKSQVLEQMKMYHAAGRIYARYGLSAIGIPYQYGLVRSTSASDLPEGMLNNSDRPDIVCPQRRKVINPGRPIVHFNEGDLGSGIPQVLMHDILAKKGMPPETTLHDVRWGDNWKGRFIWVFEISGGAPPAHFGGWDQTFVYRQTSMYFPKGGGTCSGVSVPGEITWARFYERFGKIGMDVGTGEVVKLPKEELKKRLECTSKEWPIANVYIPGYGRDQLMSTHRSNHITIAYGNFVEELAATCKHLGMDVNVIGDARRQFSW